PSYFLFPSSFVSRALHSFPTRRSSDLRRSIAQLSLLTDFIFVAIFIGHWIERGLTYKRSFTITIERNVKECDMFFIDRMKNYRRSEEHTSELQSRFDLVCRLLLEKKKR